MQTPSGTELLVQTENFEQQESLRGNWQGLIMMAAQLSNIQ
jgi:hypothetical protein